MTEGENEFLEIGEVTRNFRAKSIGRAGSLWWGHDLGKICLHLLGSLTLGS